MIGALIFGAVLLVFLGMILGAWWRSCGALKDWQQDSRDYVELINELLLAVGSANFVIINRRNKLEPQWETYAESAAGDLAEALALAHRYGFFGERKS